MLKININSLQADPEVFSATIDNTAFDLGSDVRMLDAVDLQCEIHRLSEKIIIRGQVSTRILLKCARCLNDFEMDLQSSLFLLALPLHHPGTTTATGDGDPESDDPAIIRYCGEQVDLLPEIQSALILAMPMKPLCQQDCPGLCVHCGKRLSDGPCSCSRETSSGPFAVLKDYKKYY